MGEREEIPEVVLDTYLNVTKQYLPENVVVHIDDSDVVKLAKLGHATFVIDRGYDDNDVFRLYNGLITFMAVLAGAIAEMEEKRAMPEWISFFFHLRQLSATIPFFISPLLLADSRSSPGQLRRHTSADITSNLGGNASPRPRYSRVNVIFPKSQSENRNGMMGTTSDTVLFNMTGRKYESTNKAFDALLVLV